MGPEIGLLAIAFGALSAGAGITQGVLAYKASQDAAKAKEQQAVQVEKITEENARDKTLQYRSIMAEQRAAAGASGGDLSGTPMVIGDLTLALADRETSRMRADAHAQAGELRKEAKDLKFGGQIQLFTGIASGIISGVTTTAAAAKIFPAAPGAVAGASAAPAATSIFDPSAGLSTLNVPFKGVV